MRTALKEAMDRGDGVSPMKIGISQVEQATPPPMLNVYSVPDVAIEGEEVKTAEKSEEVLGTPEIEEALTLRDLDGPVEEEKVSEEKPQIEMTPDTGDYQTATSKVEEDASPKPDQTNPELIVLQYEQVLQQVNKEF